MIESHVPLSGYRHNAAPWRLSALLLALFGGVTVILGLYFIFVRPPFLAEDLRYFHASRAQLAAVAPDLAFWLKQVFRVMGGYVVATGVLTIAVAMSSFRLHERTGVVGAFIGGVASIGLMATVNFMIDSDFKWTLLSIALLWAWSIVKYWIEARTGRAT